MKYYAVKKGRITGIYYNWDDTKRQVDGFPGAIYKSFTSMQEAKAFLVGEEVKTPAQNVSRKTIQTKAAPKKLDLGQYAAVIYTDGGSRNTGNVAGGHVRQGDKAAWAYLIQLGDQNISDSAGEFGATNNKMEITALLESLKQLIKLGLNEQKLLFILDSQYVLQAFTKRWIYGWAKRGWTRSAGELANKELWQEIYRLLPRFKQMNFEWTKGHENNQGNVFVDELLNKTMDRM